MIFHIFYLKRILKKFNHNSFTILNWCVDRGQTGVAIHVLIFGVFLTWHRQYSFYLYLVSLSKTEITIE